MRLRKGYSDGSEGQVHWRMAEPATPPTRPDLYCFSPAPFSSIAYSSILPHLANHRRVIAPDYPGQGGSAGGGVTPTIEAYAEAMLAVAQNLSGGAKVDVLGFHSGCLVAVETALQNRQTVDQVVLIDVPAFDPETRANFLPKVGAPFEPTPDLESMARAWDMSVTKRIGTQSLKHSLAMFADMAAHGPRMNATFHAAFSYNVERKLGALHAPTTIIATQSMLLEPSRRASSLIPECQIIEALEITRSVLDLNASATAALVENVIGS